MNSKELAQLLNGREYGSEITKQEQADAKKSGLVVVFGYSDDNMELRGAIHDEISCYVPVDQGRRLFFIHQGGLLSDPSQGDCEHCAERANAQKPACAQLRACWNIEGDSGPSWSYELSAANGVPLPVSSFDVMEDDELYCRGIVFALEDLPKLP